MLRCSSCPTLEVIVKIEGGTFSLSDIPFTRNSDCRASFISFKIVWKPSNMLRYYEYRREHLFIRLLDNQRKCRIHWKLHFHRWAISKNANLDDRHIQVINLSVTQFMITDHRKFLSRWKANWCVHRFPFCLAWILQWGLWKSDSLSGDQSVFVFSNMGTCTPPSARSLTRVARSGQSPLRQHWVTWDITLVFPPNGLEMVSFHCAVFSTGSRTQPQFGLVLDFFGVASNRWLVCTVKFFIFFPLFLSDLRDSALSRCKRDWFVGKCVV
jgi:hypothetical protein